jgi:hypothetical protein
LKISADRLYYSLREAAEYNRRNVFAGALDAGNIVMLD